jgi:HEAT repeat protein
MSARISPVQPQNIAAVLSKRPPGLDATKIYEDRASGRTILTHPSLSIAYTATRLEASTFRPLDRHPRYRVEATANDRDTGPLALVDVNGGLKAPDSIQGAYTLLDIGTIASTVIGGKIQVNSTLELRAKILDDIAKLLVTKTNIGILAIGKTKDPELTGWIRPFLNDPNDKYRHDTLAALGHLGGDEAFNLLMENLSTTDIPTLINTIHALGRLGDQRATPSLINQLTSQNSNIRYRTIEALRRIKDPRAYSALLDMAQNDSDKICQNEAIRALGKLKDPSVYSFFLSILKKHPSHDEGFSPIIYPATILALGDLGDDRIVPLFIKLLHKTALIERKTSEANALAIALGKIGTPKAQKALDEYYNLYKNNDRLSEGAIIAFRYFNDMKYHPIFVHALNYHKEDRARYEAAIAIAGFQNPNSYDILRSAFDNENSWLVKVYILEALVKLGDPRVYDLLFQIYNTESETILLRNRISLLGALYQHLSKE